LFKNNLNSSGNERNNFTSGTLLETRLEKFLVWSLYWLYGNITNNFNTMINKKDIKRLKKGDRNLLMQTIDDLLDTYEEDKFSAGYSSCLSDLNVHSQLLAEYIEKKALKVGRKAKTEMVWILEVDELTKLIEDYFTKALNKK
jgi:hypothetical protein